MDIGTPYHRFLDEGSDRYVSSDLPLKLLLTSMPFTVVVSPIPQLFTCIWKDSTSDMLSVNYIILMGYDACKSPFLYFFSLPKRYPRILLWWMERGMGPTHFSSGGLRWVAPHFLLRNISCLLPLPFVMFMLHSCVLCHAFLFFFIAQFIRSWRLPCVLQCCRYSVPYGHPWNISL